MCLLRDDFDAQRGCRHRQAKRAKTLKLAGQQSHQQRIAGLPPSPGQESQDSKVGRATVSKNCNIDVAKCLPKTKKKGLSLPKKRVTAHSRG